MSCFYIGYLCIFELAIEKNYHRVVKLEDRYEIEQKPPAFYSMITLKLTRMKATCM